jgi:transposase-like protein
MQNVLEPGRLAQLMDQIRSANSSGSWMKQAASMIVEQMLNAEVDDRLGRVPSQRLGDQQVGYRNGYKSRRLKTAEGRLDVDVPQVRDHSDGTYRSEIWNAIKKKSPALQKLACEMYARGLSTRDIEELLGELCESQGDLDQTLLSKSAVSEVTHALWEEYEAFTKRDLSGYDVVYLFCDASRGFAFAVYESFRQQTGVGTSQAILVSWAICSDGSKQLLHMSLGNKESADAWLEHFRSMVSRNLPVPLTVTSDGAPGTIKAIEAMWPESERIRCWFHKMANVLDKVPDDMREELKRALQDVRDSPDHETGVKWSDELPVLEIAPEESSNESAEVETVTESTRTPVGRGSKTSAQKQSKQIDPPKVVRRNGLSCAIPLPGEKVAEPKTEKAVKVAKPKPSEAKPARVKKVNPELASKARELRDKYLEQFNVMPPTLSSGKYNVARVVETSRQIEFVEPMKLLAA